MVRLSGFLQSVDEAHQFLGGMGYGHIVMLALSSLLGKICSKAGISKADVLGGVEDGIAQVSGPSFFHVGIAVVELPGLVG